MQILFIVIVGVVGLTHGAEIKNPLLQDVAVPQIQSRATNQDPKCLEPGDRSQVTCLSRTHFIFNNDVLGEVEPFECANGTVCVNLEGICFANVTPDCSNSEPGNQDCAYCGPKTAQTCVSRTEYAICASGKPLKQYARKCSKTEPYCKIVLDFNGAVGSTCTDIDIEAHCNNDVVEAN